MSDPFLTGAQAVLGGIKKGLELGKEAEKLSGDVGNFINAGAQRKYAEARAYQKRFGTVTDETIKLYMHKKKVEQMEKELKESIIKEYGPKAWDEVLKLHDELKKKREKDLENYKKDKFKSKFLAVFAFCILPMIMFFTYAVFKIYNH